MAHVHGNVEFLAPELQALEHVAVKCTQRRDVDDLYALLSGAFLLYQFGEYGQEHSFSFSRARRRNQKHVFASQDRRERFGLGQRGVCETHFCEGFLNGFGE